MLNQVPYHRPARLAGRSRHADPLCHCRPFTSIAVSSLAFHPAEKLFDPTVNADFTSLSGGEPAVITNVQLVDGWPKATGMAFHAWHRRGDESVRTHVLSS